MNDQNYDVIVIGTGPGGEGAAMKAAKDGKSVAVIEKHHLVGGGDRLAQAACRKRK